MFVRQLVLLRESDAGFKKLTAFAVALYGSRPGGGNVLPSPPKCLHECGGCQGTTMESRGIDEDAEGCSRQQLDQKSATLNEFGNHRGIGANPGASTTFL
jgi:hypothetical protein